MIKVEQVITIQSKLDKEVNKTFNSYEEALSFLKQGIGNIYEMAQVEPKESFISHMVKNRALMIEALAFFDSLEAIKDEIE